ncbi:hypothetical protein EV175_000758 [Coemansia sp. RSA 1933]|nr:hypothetical protein EV175_000758 [Coemansia sp. RSA 1933]
MPMLDTYREKELPVPTHSKLRRSRSGDMPAKQTPSAGERRPAFAHHRTTSASSLTSVALTPSINSPPSPAAKRVGRFASAIRSGLRKTPTPQTTAAWPASRARAATNVAADHASSAHPAILPSHSFSSPATTAGKTITAPVHISSSNDVVSAGYDVGLPNLPTESTLPSPPPTASTHASDTLLVAGIDAAGAQYHQSLFCGTDAAAATSVQGTKFRPRKRSLSVGGENACRDFFARQIEQYGLQSLLTSPVAVCYFMASAISNYSPETLLFYIEVEHYRNANFASNDRRTRYAKGLYKAFISNRAPLEINISHGMRQRITQAFRTNDAITTGLFKETQDHVYALLEQDYSTFRQRPLFHRMMAELSSSPASGGPSSRKETHMLHIRAVSAIYDALSKTYGVLTLPACKSKLVESEMPTFTKFADMDLTSTELKVALPAWLCRTTVRLIDTQMPVSFEHMCQLQRNGGDMPGQSSCVRPTTTAINVQSSSNSIGSVQETAPPPNMPLLLPLDLQSKCTTNESENIGQLSDNHSASTAPTAPLSYSGSLSNNAKHNKKANKQKSLQRLRLRFQADHSNVSGQRYSNSSQDSTLPPPTKSRWESLWGGHRRKAT